MATTVLISGSGVLNTKSIMGATIDLGQTFEYKKITAASGVMAVHSLDTGVRSEYLPRNKGSISDRAPNKPSGYSTLGVPTYGDGELNNTTTWALDTSSHPQSGAVTYMTPFGDRQVQFDDLV